jgi:AcrR family transcriptional regulator
MEEVADRDGARRRAILDAARSCFLQFGFAKTSLDDIAKRANLSRPLLYRKYKNKEAIYGAVYDDVFDSRYPLAKEILEGRSSKAEKLLRIYDLIVVETWAMVMDSPMAKEFYDACMRVIPDIHAKHERKLYELTRALFDSKETTHVFMLSVDGLMGDLPSAQTLHKRIALLVERFAS